MKGILLWLMIGTLLFCVNFLLLGEYIGAVLNFIGFIRAILFLKKDRLHTDNTAWLFGFTLAYLGALLCECFNIVSILIAMYRFNRKKQD